MERAENRPEHGALIRRARAEGMELLSSDTTLPLADPVSAAVIGSIAELAQVMGGGAAQLNAHHSVSLWQGLAAILGED